VIPTQRSTVDIVTTVLSVDVQPKADQLVYGQVNESIRYCSNSYSDFETVTNDRREFIEKICIQAIGILIAIQELAIGPH
jgi:hypothetical protein